MSECTAPSILDCCLSDLNMIKDSANLIRVINYYHFNRCSEKDCGYSFFVRGLNTIYDELEKEKSEDITRLKFYCIMRTELFIKSRIYIHKLAEIEKKRLALEKEFQKVLSAWNKKRDTMPSPDLHHGQ